MTERAGSAFEIRYVRALTSGLDEDTSGLEEAARAAKESDCAILCLGEPANLSGECRSRAFLRLPGAQSELLRRVVATGTPVVLVVFAGRPLVLGEEAKLAQALLYAWHAGTMTGPAIAETLLGDVAPSGKLPVTFPRAEGPIPIYYAHKNTGRPPKTTEKGIRAGTPLDPKHNDASYVDVEITPEFPFGFGLSYTTFEYSNLRVSPGRAPTGTPIGVRFTLTNTGNIAATEVAQLYVRDLVGSITRPVRELKAFERVALEPGESREVAFDLTSDALGYYDNEEQFVVEPGKFQLFVGGDSRATLCATFELT